MRQACGRAVLPETGEEAGAPPGGLTRLVSALIVSAGLLTVSMPAMASGKARNEAAQQRRAAMAVPAHRSAAAATRKPRHPQAKTAHRVGAAPSATPARAVVPAIAQAVRATGVDPALLVALAWQESRFNARARNPRSSARGLMQFTEATWLEVLRDFGPRHGLSYLAAKLSSSPATGAIAVRDPRRLRHILGLRDNPRLAAVLAAERINRARLPLEQLLGRDLAAADLYFIHLLGPTGAQRFLEALQQAPGRPAIEVISQDGLARNREVFIASETGRPLSLAEVHRWAERNIAGHEAERAPVLRALGIPSRPVMEVASAR